MKWKVSEGLEESHEYEYLPDDIPVWRHVIWWWFWGLWYGYPLCCIREWVNESKALIVRGYYIKPKVYKGLVDERYVPCSKCFNRINKRLE